MTAPPLFIARDVPLPTDSNPTPTLDDTPPTRLLKVPDAAPPFDGEFAPKPRRATGYGPPQAPLPPRMPITRTVADDTSGPAGPGDWPPRFARILTEVMSGSRPAQQITPWLTQRARFHLHRLMPGFRYPQRPRVLRVMTSQPTATVVEMSVVVGIGTRARALALRLEQVVHDDQPTRWLCTDIEAA